MTHTRPIEPAIPSAKMQAQHVSTCRKNAFSLNTGSSQVPYLTLFEGRENLSLDLQRGPYRQEESQQTPCKHPLK